MVRTTAIRRTAATAVLAGVLAGAISLSAVEPDLRLVAAAARQDVAAARALIDAGVDVDARRSDGVSVS